MNACFFHRTLNPLRMVYTALLPTMLLLTILLIAGSALAGPLQLQAAFDNDMIFTEQPSPGYLEVLVTASSETSAVQSRLPLNLALVIDTSG
ncbi:MAG: hypothetical protein D3904_13415, partial [Candidatus Electrothrix sp. EH2]|nr:hypothetical protein [Candidatus Electrothrix sp. EH2]